MPGNHKLTWQEGSHGRRGRWKKKYKGKTYYFDGGKGKSDRVAYKAALAAFEAIKQEIDAAGPSPIELEYLRAIDQWQRVSEWCERHPGEDDRMSRIAAEKIAELRHRIAKRKLPDLSIVDRFEGQFTFAGRYPILTQDEEEFDRLICPSESEAGQQREPPAAVPGTDERMGQFPTAIIEKSGGVVPAGSVNFQDPLLTEKSIWQDRLRLMQTSGVPEDETIRAYADLYIKSKTEAVESGDLSNGRLDMIRRHLNSFTSWFGDYKGIGDIDSKVLLDYRDSLNILIKSDSIAGTSGRDRLDAVKTFIRWLYHTEAISVLPRVMEGKSQALQIKIERREVVTFTKGEITTTLKEAADRTKLYVLLMLNCGMTQKDIADLARPEVDWNSGRISRKRSKTKHHENVPEVSYVLWPETLRLLQQEQSAPNSDRVLLNRGGEPLWHEVLDGDKRTKVDNIKSAYTRLRTKTEINKPLIAFKKTSASLLRNNERFSGLESLFLGHAPQSMADKHYARVPQDLFDEAVLWLGREYGVIKEEVAEEG